MKAKPQNSRRTIVTSYQIQIADLQRRQLAHKGQSATRVDGDAGVAIADVVIGRDTPYHHRVSQYIFIEAWEPYELHINNGGQTVMMELQGVFCLTGKIDNVTIRPKGPNDMRIQVVAI